MSRRDAEVALRAAGALGRRRVVATERLATHDRVVGAVLDDGTELVVKRDDGRRPGSRSAAAWARTMRAHEESASALARRAPRVVGVDGSRRVAVWERCRARPFADVLAGGAAARHVSARLGADLAELHAAGTVRSRRAPLARPPSIHVFEPPTFDVLADAPGRDYARFYAHGQEVTAELRALCAGWRTTAFVHGDLKCDNVLLGDDGSAVLVDWELAGLGDPMWDVGTVLGHYVHAWLSRVVPREGETLSTWLATTDPPFDAVRASAAALWSGYGRVTPDDACRAAGYAAVFLLDRGFASLWARGRLAAGTWLGVELAKSMLRDPRAGAGLLGAP
ncbi:MAG TPA: phosphotransferase [Frankiaceae bacterium]|nr:phosphotransferase [Frankiaceae bacterium]